MERTKRPLQTAIQRFCLFRISSGDSLPSWIFSFFESSFQRPQEVLNKKFLLIKPSLLPANFVLLPDLSLTEISHHVVNDLLNFCTWMKDRSDLNLDVEEECIVPIIKFFLEDANQEVAKTAYSHLAVMINRGKISKREYPWTVQGSCDSQVAKSLLTKHLRNHSKLFASFFPSSTQRDCLTNRLFDQTESLENHFCSCLAKVINDTFDDDFRLQTINVSAIQTVPYFSHKQLNIAKILSAKRKHSGSLVIIKVLPRRSFLEFLRISLLQCLRLPFRLLQF